MKKLIMVMVCLCSFIWVRAQQYYCQPYYGDNKIRIYTTTNPVASSPAYTVDLSADVSAAFGEANDGPNDVVFYQQKMFVSFDLGDNTGGVLVYNLSDVLPTRDGTAPTVIKPQLTNGAGLPCAGITINPANGDLFIPTFYTGNSDAGVYQYTAASNYTTGTQFASYYNDNSVAQVCANLAFDANGNMWMTTWEENDNASQHYLICYKGLDKNNYYKVTNMATAAYSATNTSGAVTTGLNLLSAPEGIAFDPSGNLWLGNNNDSNLTNGAGQGTLVEFPASYISTLLGSPSTGESSGNPTYSPTTGQVNIEYIAGGKEGGIYFNGSVMYLNDQGQNQGSSYTTNGTVWKWDVTTAFNATNFAASGIHTTYPGNGGGSFLPAGNATLSALAISQGTLSPAFASGTGSYTASVANSISSITVTPTAAAAGSTIKVNGTAVTSGSASGGIPLSVGTNTITTAVTASNGTTTDSYTIAVTRAAAGGGAAPQYYCQPYYSDNKIRIYSTSNPVASSPAYTIDVSADVLAAWGETATGPNDVVFYKNKMFVSFDLGDRGGVLVYNLTDALPARDGTAPMVLKPQTTNGLSTAGLAINPANGDLYVATFNDGDGDDSGVYQYTAASNYGTVSQFSSYFNDNSVAAVCANLAFDASGNLWMTTWTADDSATDHFLICYKGLNKNNYYKIINTATPTYSATAVNGTVTTGLNLLSAPEGIAFDPSGNLWLGNNNDFALTNGAGQGTLDEFTSAYISTLLGSPSTGSGAGNPTYSPSAAQVNIKYIAGGKEGGIYFNGSVMYLNDQGQNQGSSYTTNGTVWKWDVTTAFNATNFAASGIHTTYPGNGGGAILPAGNATLSSLATSQGTLSPVFASATTSYTASVANGITSLTVTPTAADATAIIKVNGTAVSSGTASAAIPLNAGSNTITIAVIAGNGITTSSYTITVTRTSSSVATLSNLTISSGTLSPAFATATTSYTDVAHAVSSIAFRATTTDPLATETINGTAVPEGTVSPYIPLNAGVNNISIIVTAQDGVTKDTYTIAVTRLPEIATLSKLTISSGTLTPAFASGTTSYTDVAHAVSSIAFRATTTDALATETINGTAVPEGTVSPYIPLSVGVNNISIVVTAQDGVTKDTYTIAVTRLPNIATLSKLTISSGTLTPAFATATTSYTDNVANTVSSIAFRATTTDALATETINGTAVPEGTVSPYIPLNAGVNNISIVVTAQDGVTTETYTIAVTRASSSNIATLANLTISNGTLSPAFASGTTSYTDVAHSVSSVAFRATTTDALATETINGTAVPEGTVSPYVPLNVGVNNISIVVTAQDGVTKDTYTVAVTRLPNVATLSKLTISSGTLSPAFATGTTSYTDVAHSVSSIAFRATTTDALATETINGTAVPEGTVSPYIPLNVGVNNISIVVTAQDGVTTDTYKIAVTRLPEIATLSGLTISSGTLSPAFAAATTSYTDNVANTVSSIAFRATTTDALATETINGTAVPEGTVSPYFPLNVGPNTITIIVTAQDGVTTETYTIAATRAAPVVADAVYQPVSVEITAETPRLEDDIVIVHQGVSPNGDGVDDFLQIDGILAFPDNRLAIMNRNGMLVYETKGYDNASRVFDGHSNKNGQMQLPGTYFYELDYTINGTIKHKTGFLVLKY
jgi:gliding motility-associated-like protein